MKQLNLDLQLANKKWVLRLHEMTFAYMLMKMHLYKEKMKRLNNKYIVPQVFEPGQKVLLNYWLKLFLVKLRLKYSRPFEIV